MVNFETGVSGQAGVNKKVFLTWADVNDMVKEIHKYLLASTYLVEAIVMPHKGGIIPATMLSYRLKIDELYVIKMRDNDLVFPKDITNLARKNILILDNIIHKGENIPYLMKLMERVGVANLMVVSLIHKPSDDAICSPEYSARSVNKDDWAIFPWEEMDY